MPGPPSERHACNFSTTASTDITTWLATVTITNARAAEAELDLWLEGDQLIVCPLLKEADVQLAL